MHTLTTRRQWAAAVRIHATVAGSARAASTPAPPGSTTVSRPDVGSGSAVVAMAGPLLVAIAVPSTLATLMAYRSARPSPGSASDAAANTSDGPNTSSAWTPG